MDTPKAPPSFRSLAVAVALIAMPQLVLAQSTAAADLLASKGFKVTGAVGAQSYEQEGGTLIKTAKPASAGAAAQSTAGN